jgi:hypothetical protein
MILEAITLLIGVGLGASMRSQKIIDQYNKSFEEVDLQVRKELELNKNLVESYKQDIARLKNEINTLKFGIK